MRTISYFLIGSCLLLSTSAFAQDAGPAPAKHHKAKHVHHGSASGDAKAETSDAHKQPDTPAWAAVDPDRATGMAPPPKDAGAAAMPSVQHTIHPDENRMDVGVKMSSGSGGVPGQASTQGVIDELHRNIGSQVDSSGTDAEAGLKFHF